MQRSPEQARQAVLRKAADALGADAEGLAARWIARIRRRLAARVEPLPEERIERDVAELVRGIEDVLRDPRLYRTFLDEGEHERIAHRLAQRHVEVGGRLTSTLDAYMRLRQELILASRETFRESDRPFFDLMGRLNRCIDRVVFAIAEGYFEAFQAQLRNQATTDPLTGLGNSRRFREALASELKRSGRTGRSFSLIFVDVDDFKVINDRKGHVAADRVLQEIGRTLTRRLRSSDMVCRWGGDEFIILLPETHRGEAAMVADQLRDDVVGEEACAGATISLGVACFPGDGADYDSLVAAADRALYQSKRGGKNRVTSSRPTSQNEFAF